MLVAVTLFATALATSGFNVRMMTLTLMDAGVTTSSICDGSMPLNCSAIRSLNAPWSNDSTVASMIMVNVTI